MTPRDSNGMEMRALIETGGLGGDDVAIMVEEVDGLILVVYSDEGETVVAVFGRKESEKFPGRSA